MKKTVKINAKPNRQKSEEQGYGEKNWGIIMNY